MGDEAMQEFENKHLFLGKDNHKNLGISEPSVKTNKTPATLIQNDLEGTLLKGASKRPEKKVPKSSGKGFGG